MNLRHATALWALLSACGAHAAPANLLQNGSFETGSFDSWVTRLGDATTFVDGSSSTGRHYDQATDGRWLAFFGSTAADGGASISQAFATTAGATYQLSFDLANSNGGGAAANGFSAAVDADRLLNLMALGDQDYVRYGATFVATGPSATLTLAGFNDASYLELDNLVIAAVPEPSKSALYLLGLGALVTGVRAKRRG